MADGMEREEELIENDESDSDDEVFLDPEADGGRRIVELEGQDMDEDEDEEMEEMQGEGEDDEAGQDVNDEEEAEDEEVEDVSTSKLIGHTDPIYSVAVHPTVSDIIATGSGDDTASIWSKSTGERKVLSGHTDTVVVVAFNSSGSMLASAGMDGLVKIWNPTDGSLMRTLEGPSEDITWINWHSKGDVIIAGSSDMSVWMWNAATGACMTVLSGHSDSVTCGQFSEDGKLVITGSSDCSARIWNPKDGSCLVNLSDPKNAGHFHQGGVTCLDTKGELLLTGSEDTTAILTTIHFAADGTPTAKVVTTYRQHTDGIESVAIAPRTHYIATASLDSKIFVYEMNHDVPRYMCQHRAGVTKITWHPTRDMLLSTSLDKTVMAWEGKTGSCLARLTGHKNAVLDVAASPIDNHLVSGSDDHMALVWQLV